MVIAKRRNDCVDEAIKQKNETLSEIVERELSREEKDPNYEVTYTLKDLNRSTPRNSTRRTVQRLTPEEREQRRQRYQQRRLERQIQRENQNLVTVRLPASNSTTTSPSATVGTFGTIHVVKTIELNFNLINQQLAEAHLTASDSSDSSDTDTEDEMANAVLDYLEDNLHNHTSLRVDPFYGDGTQDPLQWMLHFEKVAKKIRKYATYLEDDAEEWYDEINAGDMAD
ncbi:hypothetical protein Glove_319g99 [Diversispora epigaea]|uniref:Uncharacterized protein n=1 Tax=Diversispora epigaea TaxID=1348612 RepID=A0A397HU72_9GLOM|nr:hypothetical protein Glove_319g99 [Diversispora epigaea]